MKKQERCTCGTPVAHPVTVNLDGVQYQCCSGRCAASLTARVHEQEQQVLKSIEEANAVSESE